ncbi:hypothetical protein E2C01_026287 [Portunus trituberculatus]|uniref:Uncharacterized protein n=1 Tax=Portunus trituberculatus TaxID=210409 RepID=A0A5B7EFA4_PORTR|nr:hypothetical protein [Portunus trituberculatus]
MVRWCDKGQRFPYLSCVHKPPSPVRCIASSLSQIPGGTRDISQGGGSSIDSRGSLPVWDKQHNGTDNTHRA